MEATTTCMGRENSSKSLSYYIINKSHIKIVTRHIQDREKTPMFTNKQDYLLKLLPLDRVGSW